MTDHVILNHGQVTWTAPERASSSPNYHTTPAEGRFSSRQIERAIEFEEGMLISTMKYENLGGRTGKILRPVRSLLKSKNQEINRLQLAVKLPWAIFFESVDIIS
ncbi:hypothetical protein TNCV_880571 [Trichonephila clavipes]|nr:hypothetical protein TNCV_880571 [Trichonephila clavipes]